MSSSNQALGPQTLRMQSEDIFKPHIHLVHTKQLDTAKRVTQQLSTYMEVNEITEEGSGEGLFLNHYGKVLDKFIALEQRETVEKIDRKIWQRSKDLVERLNFAILLRAFMKFTDLATLLNNCRSELYFPPEDVKRWAQAAVARQSPLDSQSDVGIIPSVTGTGPSDNLTVTNPGSLYESGTNAASAAASGTSTSGKRRYSEDGSEAETQPSKKQFSDDDPAFEFLNFE
ncbi:hypothetical protein HD553DRAFT_326910 [Filobasidium floriforme]|uniref:uncharacterized protein n=1 Tax=Filobasidium floriforme TaxID=5210 RepID=UPI001E8DD5EA|nr:uncharacterized protein HD553DRAFT_326910 [Filobasidium floriforme]KAH8078265.1 hypothetical protein HD553DRAFT_326910 [Filobasidium floriforme]